MTLKPNFRFDELQALAVFAAIVEHGSLSAAARRLDLTPSAVSQRLRALEAAHGVTLLHRSTRKLALTEVGARLHAHCRMLLQAAEGAQQTLELARDALVGELRISAPVGFAGHIAPALLALTAQHPALNVRVIADDRLIDLIDARVDLALRAGRLPDSNWVARRLCAFGWAVCASPDYLARAGTPRTPAELAPHMWIGHEAGAGSLPVALTGPGGARESLLLKPRVICNNQLSIGQFCAAGLGLAMLVKPDVAELLRSGRLVPLLADWQLADTPVWAVTPQRDGQPAKVRHAIAALEQTLRALPGATG